MVDAAANDALNALEACPCCLLGPQQRCLNTPYTHLGNTEIYSDMLRECFNIQLDVASDECGICEECVVRLRDASHFKWQVQRSQVQLRERLARALTIIEEAPHVTVKSETAEEDGTSDNLSGEELADETAGSGGAGGGAAIPSLAQSDMNTRALATALDKTCSVSLDQMFVDTEHRTCRVGSQTYKLSLYSQSPRPISEGKRNNFKKSNLKTAETEAAGEQKASGPRQVYSVTNEGVGEMPGAKHSKTANTTKETTPYKCNQCSYASAHKSHLVGHVRLHTGEKPYKCSHCSYASAHKSHLVGHVRLHTGDKPYKCSHCSYASADKSNLVVHEKRKHTGQKPRKLSCSYTNAQRSLSLVHEKHTGDKLHKCSHCSYASAQKCHLVVHLRRHTGEKPYKCSHCSYASARKSTLLVHERNHTGEKPYKCSYCSFASISKSRSLIHERKHNSEYKVG